MALGESWGCIGARGKGFGGGFSGIRGQVGGFGGARFAVFVSGHWDGSCGPGWRVVSGALGNMVRMGQGLEQAGSVTGVGVSELEFVGDLGYSGGDGTFFCHKRHVIDKKLGVLAQTFLSVLTELGWWGARSDRLRTLGTREPIR